ncbi:hypothetical protein JS86_24940 [Vibrio vulnificus]|nr:hypothetical protein JS86_24940 [Vibrio vulnificus]
MLHQGASVEQGSPQQLLTHGKQYKQLWQLQQELKQEETTALSASLSVSWAEGILAKAPNTIMNSCLRILLWLKKSHPPLPGYPR